MGCATPELRIRLGKSPTGANLVTNGTFTSVGGGGNTATGWRVHDLAYGYKVNNITEVIFSSVNNIATFIGDQLNNKVGGAIYQYGILTPGEEYRISVDVPRIHTGDRVYIRVGERSTNDYVTTDSALDISGHTLTVDRLCLDRGDLGIEVHLRNTENTNVTNIRAFRLKWNEPLQDLPDELYQGVNQDIEEDPTVGGLVSNGIANLTFRGDAYQFIREYMKERNNCTLQDIPMIVEIRGTDGNWSMLYNFSIKIRTVTEYKDYITAEVENTSALSLILAKKDVDVIMATGYNEAASTPERWYNLHTLDRADNLGMEDSDLVFKTSANAYTCLGAFELLVDELTNSRAVVKSSLLSGLYSDAGVFMISALVNGTDELDAIINMTFKRLFSALNKFLNITMSVTYPNNVPTVNIERKIDVFVPSVVYKQLNVQMLQRNYIGDYPTALKVGAKNDAEDNVMPDVVFTPDARCANGNTLDVVVSEFFIPDYMGMGFVDQSNSLVNLKVDDVVMVQAFVNIDFSLVNRRKNTAIPPYIKPTITFYDSSYSLVVLPDEFDIRYQLLQVESHSAYLPHPVSANIRTRLRTYTPTEEAEVLETAYNINICQDEWKEMTNGNINKELIVHNDFKNAAGWATSGWTVANGLASYTYAGANHLRQTLPNLPVQGKYYLLKVEIDGATTINDETPLRIYACNSAFTQLFTIGEIKSIGINPGQVQSTYYFHFENTSATFAAIELKLESIGTPAGIISIHEISLTESVTIHPMQKQFNINGNRGRASVIRRNTRTGATEITIKTPETWR